MKKIYLFFLISFFNLYFNQTSFHDTQGNIDVNGGGQLQYTLPIALPPGIKNVAPQMELTYTSGSGNGIAGYGWNLSGITSISRMGKIIEKDGELKGIQLDYSDFYQLNGQRLILKTGEYGKDGATYTTEKYSNIKIKSVGETVNWKCPQYWEVTFEDGSQAWYGNLANANNEARNRMEFNIVKWKDAQGNIINYSYYQEENVITVKSITWGGNETLNKANFNEIIFNYTNRDLVESTFINGAGTAFIQSKLLTDIRVASNGSQFKKYILGYFKNGTNYQFLNKITEYNSNNEAANPVTFDYPALTPSSVEEVYTSNSDPFDGVKLTGDFNGDSYLDFVMSNGTVKLGVFNDNFTTVTTNKYFNSEALVVNALLDEEGQIYNGNGIVQLEGNKLAGYVFKNNSFQKVYEKQVFENPCSNYSLPDRCILSKKLNEGDFDGDGISNVFVEVSANVTVFYPCPESTNNKYPQPGDCSDTYTIEIGNFIVDLKDVNLPISTYIKESGINYANTSSEKYMDVDGDGKVESINVSNTAYTVFEFLKTGTNQYKKRIRFTKNLTETKQAEFPVLFGDFNGDGRLDFTIPITDTAIGKPDNWRFYMGTGNGFNDFLKIEFLTYRKRQTDASGGYTLFAKQYFFAVADINRDGKSDVVQVFSYNQINWFNTQYRNFGYVISSKLANGTLSNGSVDFVSDLSYSSPQYSVQDVEDLTLFVPLTNPIKANNNYYNVYLYWKQYLKKVKAPTTLAELSRIKSINQGGLTTSISYLELNPDVNSNFYKKEKKEYYPFFSLQRADQSYAVSQIQQSTRKQDFRYRGMTAHLQGRGLVGFHQSARSSWYATGFENTKIWSGTEIDPLNEGLPVKEWSIKTNDENQIFPTDLSVSNNQLLSLKLSEYQIDILSDGIKAIVPKKSTTKDFLKDITTVNTVSYGAYYLPTQTINSINNNFAVSTTDMVYIHNINGVGKDYYVGRPLNKVETTQVYGDTKSAKTEYAYNANTLLDSQKTWNRDNTGWLQENYTYDGFGNITQKIISNSLDTNTQTVKTDYEASGRFVTMKTDNLGLITNITYNNWGQVLTQTDPFGVVLTNTYDNWGKLMTSGTNLTGTIAYAYEKLYDWGTKVTKSTPDGDQNITYTNNLNQNYKSSTKAFSQNVFASKSIQYDALGRKTSESEPYFEGSSASKWNTIEYDEYSRPKKATAFTGKIVETAYNGRIITTTETNAYSRFKKQTADPVGNIISSEDKGGIINFTYDAAGDQTKAAYGDNVVTTTYDVWGRKASFNDPANGKYEYEYDGFGKPTIEFSPKGSKRYTYKSNGLLDNVVEESNDGAATDKYFTYTYNTKWQIISQAGTSNGKSYTNVFTYDIYGRPASSTEQFDGKTFFKNNLVYDAIGRLQSYQQGLTSNGVNTNISIQNNYNTWSGDLYQVKQSGTNKILWELQTTNAKGQVLTAKLGAIQISNTYDANNFLTWEQHKNMAINSGIMEVSYSFNAVKNELNERHHYNFGLNEYFTYDDNNRLISWTNPKTGQLSSNIYDEKGRITTNDQIGTVSFGTAGNIYRATKLNLNTNGTANYGIGGTNILLQNITYNENNDPIKIRGRQNDYAFRYGLTESRQIMSYGGKFEDSQNAQFTKYYSEDGSMEIITNNTTGQEKHILYIGGSPYESSIVYLKDFTETTPNFKFLHKDYLGSILAISDEAGNALERRHFDAWGIFTHLQKVNGSIITDQNVINNSSLLIDKGYTSHEHLLGVGLIHMNGRLYDPLLRRFLNADENVQDPTNTQNYNKYGYVMNNPLMYNDPNGEVFQFLLAWGMSCFWASVTTAAIIGAAVGAGSYILSAAINGTWSWSSFGASILMGAASGAVAGALSPTTFYASSGTLWLRAAGQVACSIMPSWDFNIGNFSFGISPSVAIGKGWGFGANVSATFHSGDFALSAGVGIMNYGGHSGSGEAGWEYRKSVMLNYNDGNFGFSLGTNKWNGLHSQQTGIIGFSYKKFSMTYENDGSPFAAIKGSEGILADNNDRWRTAAMTINIGNFHAGFNLFTGERQAETYSNEDVATMAACEKPGFFKRLFNTVPYGAGGGYGSKHPYGDVVETQPQYRLGAAYIGWGNYRLGIDSDRYIRHAIQDIGAHYFVSPQPGFRVLSNSINPYLQYQTRNKFTSW